jgi:hypothetical protein
MTLTTAIGFWGTIIWIWAVIKARSQISHTPRFCFYILIPHAKLSLEGIDNDS